jgi:DNA-binding response OmpR family regulator
LQNRINTRRDSIIAASEEDADVESATTLVCRETILLVDDDEDLRLLCAMIFREAGFEVVECSALSAAFFAIQKHAPDIVVLDRELPDGSGLDFARWVRCRPAYDQVRIIGFSGRNSAPEIEEALAAGCDAFLGKPCDLSMLLAKVGGRTAV